MTPTEQILLAGMIFFAAHLVSTVTGFGANVLGLPLLTLVVGLTPARQALVVLGACLYVYLTLRWHGKIDRRELARILLIAGAGLIIGMGLYHVLPHRATMALLGLFVVGVGIKGLVPLGPKVLLPEWGRRIFLFLGGLSYGVLTAGGPLLVVYCRQALPEKSTFRATLASMWLAMTTSLMLEWTLTRTWDPATPRVALGGFPFLLAGLLLGEHLHHKASPQAFARAVNATLLATGSILLWASLR